MKLKQAFAGILALLLMTSCTPAVPTETDTAEPFSEDLDYAGIFEEIFREYTAGYELVQVKTTNMGSMFRLTYEVVMKEPVKEKEMIDKIRCRNGNLEVMVSRQETATVEL